MSIVTKTGDTGETGLFGGQRLPKDHPRIEAYGTVDELNAVLGIILSFKELPGSIQKRLTEIQHLLFRVGADLATPLSKKEKVDRIGEKHVAGIEVLIQQLETSLPEQTKFILPGGSESASFLHLARTVCRRAERLIVKMKSEEEINEQILILLNRLSDYLFLLARKVNSELGVADVEVEY